MTGLALAKLRHGKPLTSTDLAELEKMLLDAGIGASGEIKRAKETNRSFGRFVPSLVGLDRAAVQEAFGGFLADGAASANKIEFINLVVEHLTEKGVMAPELIYESPCTDIAPHGPEQIFDAERVTKLFDRIEAFNESAAVA